MQSITYHVATSVDGFIADADGGFDSFLGEGDHVAAYLDELKTYGTVVMGRKTYEVGLRQGVVDPYPFLKTVVFSRSLTSAHPNVRVVAGDVAAELRRLKQAEGPGIYLCGGANLAAAALKAGLVDELALKLNPHVGGGGIPLFDAGVPTTRLSLVSSDRYASGVVLNRYRVA